MPSGKYVDDYINIAVDCHNKRQTKPKHHRITVLLDFLVTVKAAPNECVIRTGQP